MTGGDYANIYRKMTGFTPPVILSSQQRGLIRHALGLDREKKAYRNYYAANPDDAKIIEAWRDLEKRGLAKSWEAGSLIYFAASGPAARAATDRTESFSEEITGQLAKIDTLLQANRSS